MCMYLSPYLAVGCISKKSSRWEECVVDCVSKKCSCREENEGRIIVPGRMFSF